MRLSEISVRRPVFATVISLVLVILGLLALDRLAVREYPDVDPPVVSVTTNYRGASAEVIERRVTQLIEAEIAGIAGVQKLTSSSRDERSQIVVEFAVDRDVDDAANDVRERISRVLGRLPEEADPPQITKQDAGMDATMYVDVSSQSRSLVDITDFADRNLVDRLSVIDGVATIRLSGARFPAMRIWLDREAMAARGLTVQDVEDTLRRENVEFPAGRIESLEREFTLRTDTGLHTPEDFEDLVLKRDDGYIVRLGDIAEVRLEAENTRRLARTNGIPGISLGVVPQSKANILAVNQAVIQELERLKKSIVPPDIKIDVNVDFSVFIRESMQEVLKALGFALLMVLAVIYAFLGSLRATVIPAVTIPVAIVASFVVMAALDFSINTLTLLGMVLAIGLVVDDAIVVLENIVRRQEGGQPGLLAAIDGSHEIGFAVIATTVVLVAVFLPISFMPGKVGRLFGEFGISLASAVAFSSLIALTLVPMLASKLFARPTRRRAFAAALDRGFRWLSDGYRALLIPLLRRPWIAVLLVLATGGGSYLMFSALPSEYAPVEDRGMMFVWMRGPEGASPQYMARQVRQLEALAMPMVEQGYAKRILVRSGMASAGGDVNTTFAYIPLVPWGERDKSAQQLAAELGTAVRQIPGIIAMVMLPPSLNIRSSGQPLIVVLGGTDYRQLAEWSERVIRRAEENPRILGLRSDYFERKPKIQVNVDRNRASDLGVSLASVGRTLETMLGSRIVTTFVQNGEEYNVLLQARPEDRATPSDLSNIYVRSERSGKLIPLANVVRLTEVSGPVELKRFDRLRSISLTSALAPGYSLGEALDYMDRIIREEIPEGVRINYDGESREFRQSGGSIYFTFLLALVISFLVLAAQFESFRHPLIIMLTVPLALFGGLLGLLLLGSSINVFSQIGAIMLIGLAAKNGILIVEFANQLRDRGREFQAAIVEAATVRLRPVVMTSLCTAGGAVPLLLAFGAGAESRRTIGAVVFFGVTISVFLTLFLIPAMYSLLARRTRSPEHVSRLVEKLRATDNGGRGIPAAPGD
ncbi:MAG: efflux RND transporter permease subunit [Gammaproteobacteria bacterium]|nr:MAG: efflux RND transporter permease subunit [Gammaproteobacteria bacterium]